jgi:hypothetical protein
LPRAVAANVEIVSDLIGETDLVYPRLEDPRLLVVERATPLIEVAFEKLLLGFASLLCGPAMVQ